MHSPTLEQHLLDVEEVLEIFRRRQLYAKSSKCEFGRQELGFLGRPHLLFGQPIMMRFNWKSDSEGGLRSESGSRYLCRLIQNDDSVSPSR